MLKFNLSYFYILIFLVSFVQTKMIQHKIVEESLLNEKISIEVLINEDYSKIKHVTLFYKSNKQTNYLEKKMIHKGDNFFYSDIPKDYITNNGIEYYILLELNNNKIYSFPYINPRLEPIQIKIKDDLIKQKKIKSNLQENSVIQILSPLPNSRVLKNDLLISLSYFKLKNINKDKTKIFLNNRDITNKVTFYDNYFIYKPDFILDGQYNINVIFTDKYNRQLPEFKWSFTVISKDKLFVGLYDAPILIFSEVSGFKGELNSENGIISCTLAIVSNLSTATSLPSTI